MPIRPRPSTYVCTQCRWKKTVAPASDALMPGEYFGACPVCGSSALEQREPTLLELIAMSLSPRRR